MSVSKFLGLDAPNKLDAKSDAEDVSFTIEFETPDAPRMIDAKYGVFALKDPSLMGGEYTRMKSFVEDDLPSINRCI